MTLRRIWNALPLPKSPIARRLAKGGAWTLIGDACLRVSALASTAIIARWLGLTEYGAFALLQSTLAMLANFAAFGMAQTSGRYIAAYRDTQPSRVAGVTSVALSFSVLTGGLVSAALFLAAPNLAVGMLRSHELIDPLRLVSPVLFFLALTGAASGVIIGYEAFGRQARVSWISGIVSFIVLVAGVTLGGLKGACLGLVASEAFRCGMTLLAARAVLRENRVTGLRFNDTTEIPVLWRFSLPSFASSLLVVPIMWLAQTIIARQPNGLAEIGLFDASQKWLTIVSLIPIAASGAFSPILANLTGAAATQRHTTLQLMVVQLVLTSIPAAIVWLGAPWATLLFGPEFTGAAPVIALAMLLAPLFVMANLYWRVLISNERAWTVLLISMLNGVVVVAATWLMREEGGAGLVKANLAAHIVTLPIMIFIAEFGWRPRTPAAAIEAQGSP